MKVGMNMLLWTGVVTEEHLPLFASIKEWGADGVELPMFSVEGSPWKKLAKAMDAEGLGRTVVTVSPPGGNLIGTEPQERKLALTHLKACVDTCHSIGAEALCGPLYSPVGRLVGRGPNQDERQWAIEGLKALGEHAKGSKVKISIEPLNRFETYFLNTQAQSAALLDQVGMANVGHMYDTFHANIEEKSLTEAIHAGSRHLNHVHISANDRGTPGEDHVQYKRTTAALKSVGYDGWLTIESFGSRIPELAAATCIWRPLAPSEEHVVRKGVAFVRQLWARDKEA
jgi:D-psicose/D-tagatose/L-ribulose 3-epimerase